MDHTNGCTMSTTTALENGLDGLFAENVVAKVYRTALELTNTTDVALPEEEAPRASTFNVEAHVPKGYPEYVPQYGENAGRWVVRKPTLWTCGFFPGAVNALLERITIYPNAIYGRNIAYKIDENVAATLRSNLAVLAELCTEPLHKMAGRTDTHDIGFMIMPALRRRWELTGDLKSLHSIRRAAQSLATRFVPGAGAIRSWDTRIQNNVQITSTTGHLILIIDSVCNLDLLYYAASHFPKECSKFAGIATAHATTLLRTHLRPETAKSPAPGAYTGQWYSTHHVADLNPSDGSVLQHFTAQGHSDTSSWARGQSWGILGFAQTYMWTKETKFLEAACGIAENFLQRMENSPSAVEVDMYDDSNAPTKGGRYVPLWDFDAPLHDQAEPVRDSSAAAIAANGMLIISQALAGLGEHQLSARFRVSAVQIARDLARFALSREKACFGFNGERGIVVKDVDPAQRFDGLLKYGTANNNENATERYWDHALVYGDYYWVELGNRMLKMGLI